MNIYKDLMASKKIVSDNYYSEDNASSPIEIRNASSQFSSFFQLNAPFQVTYQFCSGTATEDYLNTFTLSGSDSNFSHETMMFHNYRFMKHAPHFHDYFEIMLVLEGTVLQRIESKDYLYTTGSCCLINRSLCHIETFNSASRILFIGLSVEFIEELFNSCKSAYFGKENEIIESELYHFIMSDISSPGRKSYLDFIPAWQNQSNNSNLHNLTEKLINTILFPEFGSTYQFKAIICRLLQYLSTSSNYHCTCVELNRDNDFLLFARITHLLEENDGRVSRTELERSLNYSGNYLNRITNKYTGMCLFDYGMTFCLKKAEDCLAGTNEPVSSIAAKLGFSNRTHFYTLFKEKYGMTPNEYRKECKERTAQSKGDTA
ncbi:MAG: AraC family transcriptional regulator [Lachnospiraceae bacterium]|nr:AraC family transcriptional regulator [Lachnospiraceae bacterium]